MPSRPSAAIDSRIAFRLWGSTPTVGSSSSSSRGRWSSPMPMFRRRCMPPLNVSTRSFGPLGEADQLEDLVDARP